MNQTVVLNTLTHVAKPKDCRAGETIKRTIERTKPSGYLGRTTVW